MKYYIVGKKLKEGILGDDSMGVLSEYFELGWEYAVTHLHIKHMYTNGMLETDDVIVTLRDRMFLYTSFWKNVISYEEYKNKKIESEVVDLCSLVEQNHNKYLPNAKNNKYEFWDTDIDVIKKFEVCDISKLPTENDFCCVHIRFRDWANFRNLDDRYWKQILTKLESKNIKIFIFGKGSEKYSNNEQIFHVNLNQYVTLLNNKNCKFLIGTMSGGSLISQAFSNKNCVHNIIITDEQTLREFNTHNKYKVFYHSEAFNFSENLINYININEVETFIQNL